MKNSLCIFIILLSFSCRHPNADIFKTERNIDKNISDSYTTTPLHNGSNILRMETEYGVKYVWIEINGIKLRFIFDTGASNICISKAEAIVLYKQGTLKEEDILEVRSMQDATGNISEGMLINLKTVKVGNRILNNVKALVIEKDEAPLLLG